MKRDMDLVRWILLHVEAMDPDGSTLFAYPDAYDSDAVYGHVRLLESAGYVTANYTAGNPPGIHSMMLTWAGNDLLDSIRDDSVWSEVKKKLGAVGGSASLEVLKALAGEVVRGKLGLPEG